MFWTIFLALTLLVSVLYGETFASKQSTAISRCSVNELLWQNIKKSNGFKMSKIRCLAFSIWFEIQLTLKHFFSEFVQGFDPNFVCNSDSDVVILKWQEINQNLISYIMCLNTKRQIKMSLKLGRGWVSSRDHCVGDHNGSRWGHLWECEGNYCRSTIYCRDSGAGYWGR